MAQRELQKRKLSRAHEMMLEDGAPTSLLRFADEKPKPTTKSKPTNGGVTLAPPLAVQKAIAADLGDDDKTIPQVPAPPAADQSEIDMSRKKTTTKLKKVSKAKARAGIAKKAKTDGTIRPGSKLETVAKLLMREGGCTTAEVLKATGWPSVSMPQQAKAAGLTLAKAKDGKVTRYTGTPKAA